MSHNTLKISKYDLSKKTDAELKHYVQLIKIDINNYRKHIENYPPERMEKYGIPHLTRLIEVLKKVKAELNK